MTTASFLFPYSTRQNSKITLSKREPKLSFIKTSFKPVIHTNNLSTNPSNISKLQHKKPYTSLHKKAKSPSTSYNTTNLSKTSSLHKQKSTKNTSSISPRNKDIFHFYNHINHLSTNRTTNIDFSIENKLTHFTLNNNSSLVKALCRSVRNTNSLQKKNKKESFINNTNNNYRCNSNNCIMSKSKGNIRNNNNSKKAKIIKKTSKPFYLHFKKQLGKSNKQNYSSLNKNAHIMSYNMNIKKLKKNNNNINHTKNTNITNNNTYINLNKVGAINTRNRNKNTEMEIIYKINRLPENCRNNTYEENNYLQLNNECTNDENESSLLSYEEVKDIIINFDMKNIDYNDKWLFYNDDYQRYNCKKKEKYIKKLFSKDKEELKYNNSGILCQSKHKENKSPSTNESSNTKNDYISRIKLCKK